MRPATAEAVCPGEAAGVQALPLLDRPAWGRPGRPLPWEALPLPTWLRPWPLPKPLLPVRGPCLLNQEGGVPQQRWSPGGARCPLAPRSLIPQRQRVGILVPGRRDCGGDPSWQLCATCPCRTQRRRHACPPHSSRSLHATPALPESQPWGSHSVSRMSASRPVFSTHTPSLRRPW